MAAAAPALSPAGDMAISLAPSVCSCPALTALTPDTDERLSLFVLQRGGRAEAEHRKQSMDGWNRVSQPPQPQPPAQQAQPQQPMATNGHGHGMHGMHGPASLPPAVANGHHANGLNGHGPHGPGSLPAPLSENGLGAGMGQVHDGKHSLLQFAIHHFRQSPEK